MARDQGEAMGDTPDVPRATGGSWREETSLRVEIEGWARPSLRNSCLLYKLFPM